MTRLYSAQLCKKCKQKPADPKNISAGYCKRCGELHRRVLKTECYTLIAQYQWAKLKGMV